MSRERYPALTSVPTLRETSMIDFETSSTTGILAPAGTPQAIVELLNGALRKALKECLRQPRTRAWPFRSTPTGGRS